MDREYDPLEASDGLPAPDSPEADMPVLISVDDFYDLLMEQQEQM